MTWSAQATRPIETRVFVVIMVLNLVSGLNTAFSPFFMLLLGRFVFSGVELSLGSILLSTVLFLFSPVLFFIVLYATCGGPLLNRIASVLISLIFGSLVGYLIGSFIGSLVVGFLLGQLGLPPYYAVWYLPQQVVTQVLMGFAVLALSDMNQKWKNGLPVDELMKRRLGHATLLAALYAASALLSTGAMPILILYPSMISSLSRAALVVVALGVVLGIVVAGQLVVAAGLYHGRKWAWIIAVISSATSLVMSIFILGAVVALGSSAGILMLILMSFVFIVGFVVNLAVLVYLLRVDVRWFFGFVNPPGQAQDKPVGTETA